MIIDNRPIGVFDSGVGGLTVAYELSKVLPNENFIYYGDSLRAPYGNLPKDILLKNTCEIVDFLLEFNIKAVVVACNTLCATVLDDLKVIYADKHLIFQDVIQAGVDEALETGSSNIGLLATNNTIKMGTHKEKIKSINENISFLETAAPLFVPIIEQGLYNTKIAYEAVKYYLDDMLQANIDTIILGCTHFPILADTIKDVTSEGYEITLINPANRSSIYLKNMLTEKNMLGNQGSIKFYTSGYETNFKFILDNVFTKNYDVEVVELGLWFRSLILY